MYVTTQTFLEAGQGHCAVQTLDFHIASLNSNGSYNALFSVKDLFVDFDNRVHLVEHDSLHFKLEQQYCCYKDLLCVPDC
jgi:hypothetical protein